MQALHASDAASATSVDILCETSFRYRLLFDLSVLALLLRCFRYENRSSLNVEEVAVSYKISNILCSLQTLQKLEGCIKRRKVHLSRSPWNVYADAILLSGKTCFLY